MLSKSDLFHVYDINCRVKLAIDLMTSKQVAVKILKVREGDEVSFCKYEALDHFFTEIEILSQCDHPNVVKIKSSSFDGTIVKEAIRSTTSQQKYDSNESIRKVSADIHRLVGGSSEGNISDRDDRIVLKRQSKICYYVMKLAEYGEVYRIIELNDRLSENLVRNLFKQLLDGLSYLH
jgi:serine/threonine protein kinase